ncbi:helix-turn-helix transcriptional regulator [Nocardioides sp.]|uniref:helix-turn-helix transcriptional regulator n=1 Tax=Nocardioides sp. TaxID=35761 RepID=UPI00321A0EE5
MGARKRVDGPGWPPPRGPRDPDTGRFLWPLHARPPSSFEHEWESDTVSAYVRLVDRVADDRSAQGVSVRALGAKTGVSIATITGIENGSWWPRWGTLAAIADGMGLTLAVRPDGDLLGAWEPAVIDIIRNRIARTRRLKFAAVADLIGVEPKTISGLHQTRSPSAATVLAVCAVLNLEVRPRSTHRLQSKGVSAAQHA